jgi:hypothetical protein
MGALGQSQPCGFQDCARSTEATTLKRAVTAGRDRGHRHAMCAADLRRGLDIDACPHGEGQAHALPGQGGGAGLAEALVGSTNDRAPASYAEIRPGALLVEGSPDRPAASRRVVMRPAAR